MASTLAAMLQQPPLAFDRLVETLAGAVVLTLLAAIVLTLAQSGWARAARRVRHRRSRLGPGESTFVARLGPRGPELFVVGEGVRRLLLPSDPRPIAARREAGDLGPRLAAGVLCEAMGRAPSRDLTHAFVEEQLGYLPEDGFVLPTAEVLTWLDARRSARSALADRAARVAKAWGALVASRLRPAARPATGARVPGGRSGR